MGTNVIKKIFYTEQWFYTATGLLAMDGGTTNIANGWEKYDESKISIDTDKFTPGEFLVHPYTVTRTALTGGCGTLVIEYPYYQYTIRKSWEGGIGLQCTKQKNTNLPTFSNQSNLVGRALQKAYSKVGSSDLTLGVELGELRETLATLRSPLKSLRNFFLSNRGRNLRYLKALLRGKKSSLILVESGKTAADTWLEFRYGIRPIVSSIQSIMKEVDRKRPAFFSQAIRSRSSRVVTHKADHWTGKGSGWYQFYPITDETLTTQVTARGQVYYRRFVEATLGQTIGLSAEYTPEIIWELTRLSFVVDWIFSVGPWIGSYRFKPGIEILGNTVSLKSVLTGSSTITHVSKNSNYTDLMDFTEDTMEPVRFISENYERQVDIDLPSTPFFRYADAVSYLHTVDSLALILQPLLKKL